jgi:predicted RNase H-like HicB family nuclease
LPPYEVLGFVIIVLNRGGGNSMSYKVSIVIEKDEYGFYAYSPELEGCQTQGDSLEEVLANIKEAIELYLETLSEEEIKEALSKEILTTALEVQVA